MTFPDSPGDGWLRNSGTKPDRWTRVRVFLMKGTEPTYDDRWNPMSKPGWAVDSTRWTLTNQPHDVAWYLPL